MALVPAPDSVLHSASQKGGAISPMIGIWERLEVLKGYKFMTPGQTLEL